MLRNVDSAEVTTDLWGERWAKVIANSMHNGLAAVTGLTHIGIYGQREPRRVAIRLGGEAARVGRAIGYNVESVRDIPLTALESASRGDDAALATVEERMEGWTKRMTDEGRPSTAQDVLKGRRTEIDYLNGYVCDQGKKTGVKTPYNDAVVARVRSLGVGFKPDPKNLDPVIAMLPK